MTNTAPRSSASSRLPPPHEHGRGPQEQHGQDQRRNARASKYSTPAADPAA